MSGFIIAVDPGINFCSVMVLEADKKFQVIESHLIDNSRAFTPEYKELEKIHGTRTTKVLKIIDKIKELIDKYQITELAVEAPFYSSLTPMAYGSLLEVVLGIRYLLVMPLQLDMKLIEPTAVKRTFTGKGNASKVTMREFLVAKIQSCEILMDIDPQTLSEHEVDGIAVGYTYWRSNQLLKAKPEG